MGAARGFCLGAVCAAVCYRFRFRERVAKPAPAAATAKRPRAKKSGRLFDPPGCVPDPVAGGRGTTCVAAGGCVAPGGAVVAGGGTTVAGRGVAVAAGGCVAAAVGVAPGTSVNDGAGVAGVVGWACGVDVGAMTVGPGVAGVGVTGALVPTSMRVTIGQPGLTSGRSQNTETTDVPRPSTARQPLSRLPVAVMGWLCPLENPLDVMHTNTAVLPAPTSTKAMPAACSALAENCAPAQPEAWALATECGPKLAVIAAPMMPSAAAAPATRPNQGRSSRNRFKIGLSLDWSRSSGPDGMGLPGVAAPGSPMKPNRGRMRRRVVGPAPIRRLCRPTRRRTRSCGTHAPRRLFTRGSYEFRTGA